MTKARDLANVISGSGTLNANVIPALPASKITSGTFADARLSSSSVTQHVDLTSLSASNLTSGTVPSARLSLSASDVPDLATSKITSGTFADARLSSSSVTQHVDLSNLNASNLTSGTVPNARYGTPTFSAANLTNVPASAVSTGTWTPAVSSGAITNVTAKYQKIGQQVFCQCEYQWSTPPTTGTYQQNYTVWYLSGLPFTAFNFGQAWFHGQVNGVGNNQSSLMGSSPGFVPNGMTRVYRVRESTSRQTIAFDVYNSNMSYRNHDATDMSAYNGYWFWNIAYLSAS